MRRCLAKLSLNERGEKPYRPLFNRGSAHVTSVSTNIFFPKSIQPFSFELLACTKFFYPVPQFYGEQKYQEKHKTREEAETRLVNASRKVNNDVGKQLTSRPGHSADLTPYIKPQLFPLSPRTSLLFLFSIDQQQTSKMPPKRKAMAETSTNKQISATRNTKASKTSAKSTAPTSKPSAKASTKPKPQTFKYSDANTVSNVPALQLN
jgi:hypothetical protein